MLILLPAYLFYGGAKDWAWGQGMNVWLPKALKRLRQALRPRRASDTLACIQRTLPNPNLCWISLPRCRGADTRNPCCTDLRNHDYKRCIVSSLGMTQGCAD